MLANAQFIESSDGSSTSFLSQMSSLVSSVIIYEKQVGRIQDLDAVLHRGEDNIYSAHKVKEI